MAPRAARTASLACCLAAALCPGCLGLDGPPDEGVGYFLSPRQDITRIHRVVFVELAQDAGTPQAAADTTRALADEILVRRLFHVDIVRRTDPMCRDLPLDRLGALNMKDLAQIRAALECDAVLFGRLTRFQAYPHTKLGLLLKLINLRDGELVWGVDHVWDTADWAVERRARRYFYSTMRGGYEPIGYELILKSPRAFEKFVAYEVAQTLPAPRPADAPQPARRPVESRDVRPAPAKGFK
ncbi:MAG: hypothetical protein J7M21_04185 [Planctomycetes bacterium]|nr:hypothetical protein [Planctomycetota bacterium]